jgi:hypothetical protein
MAVPCLGQGGFPCPITPLCKRIGIAIAALHQATGGRIDPFDLPLVRLDIKGAAFAHLHASYMDASGPELVGDDGPHTVTGFEPLDLLVALAVSAREALFAPIGAAMLPRPVAVIATVFSLPSRTPARSPTQSASRACVFAMPKRARFQRVRPPVQLPMGNPNAPSSWTSLWRVAFTAAASLSGVCACTSTSGCPHSAAVCAPFCRLQS